MKKLKVLIALLTIGLLYPIYGFSQISEEVITDETVGGMRETKRNKWRMSGTADGSMFQMSILEFGNKQQFSTLRYSLFFNTGFHLNKKIAKNVTFFSGLNIKNLGIILRDDTAVRKYRAYTIGAPIGLKIGQLNKDFLIIGGGVDFPFNYKFKSWVKGEKKTKEKYSEWFPTQVEPILPHGFLGYRFQNTLTAKLFYYPTNFLSDSYLSNNRSNIFMLTLGIDIGRTPGKAIKMGTKKKTNNVIP